MKKQIDQIVLINYKKHEEYKGEISGHHFIISGVNGAGKSSIFDAIKRLIGQKQEKPEEPIHQGAETATTSIYISQNGEKYCVEEKYGRGGKGRLKFYKVNGAHKDELNPALTRLQEVIGIPTDFSPLLDMDGPAQVKFFKENLGLDLSMFDHNYQNIFDSRTLVNRDIKTLQAKLNAPELRVFAADVDEYQDFKRPDDLLAQKKDVSPLFQEMSAAQTHNEKVSNARREVNNLKEQIEALQKRLEIGEKWLEENPTQDTGAILEKINAAQEHNAAIDEELKGIQQWNDQVTKVKNFVATEHQLKEKQGEAARFTKQLQDMNNELFTRLSEFKLGEIVEGLELVYETEEDERGKLKVKRAGLMLEGLPFRRNQHSYGKLLRAIIKLAGHFNAGKLNFIPIGDWNLLDEDGQAEIWQLAKEHPELGIQLGIEKVDNNRQVITELIQQ